MSSEKITAKHLPNVFDIVDPPNVITRYWESPLFQVNPHDSNDILKGWLQKHTIPFSRDQANNRETVMYFGGAPHELTFCAITHVKVYETPSDPMYSPYHRVVELRSMPAHHGIPSHIIDNFTEMGYFPMKKDNFLVRKVFPSV